MKNLVALFSLLTLLLLSSCQKSQVSSFDLLLNTWVHSYEENKVGEYIVYRPENSMQFPESHYREIIELKPNDQCQYFALSPIDAHQFVSMMWNYDEITNSVTIKKLNNGDFKILKIIEVTDKILKVKIN